MCYLKKVLLYCITFYTFLNAQDLRICHIDVDQGDATLIVAPGGRSLLIDSGRNGHGPRLRAAMQQAGVTQIDHFIATHYHEDHYGGIDVLARTPAVTIHNVYDRGDKAFIPADRLDSPTYQGYDTTYGHRARHLTRGMAIALDPALSVICISSGGVVLGEQDPVAAGASTVVRRNAMAMTLNNDGDTIQLIDPAGHIIDSFTYHDTQRGVPIATGH